MEQWRKEKLAELYNKSTAHAFIVATICDEVLDRTGKLLGEVRGIALKSKYDMS